MAVQTQNPLQRKPIQMQKTAALTGVSSGIRRMPVASNSANTGANALPSLDGLIAIGPRPIRGLSSWVKVSLKRVAISCHWADGCCTACALYSGKVADCANVDVALMLRSRLANRAVI